MTDTDPTIMLREPAEVRYAAELEALAAADTAPRPPGWKLSPRAVRTFILGSACCRRKRPKGKAEKRRRRPPTITRKFHGDDALIDRAIVTLMSNRGLLLVGEPGTAKSMLSELLAAAISGTSALTIQGTAGTTEDQIKYSWNYALLLAEGPTPQALVPAPLYHGLARPAGALRGNHPLPAGNSGHAHQHPQRQGAARPGAARRGQRCCFAKPGFNVIATANTRDRGVHEMSAALKRRFNFETVAADRRQAVRGGTGDGTGRRSAAPRPGDGDRRGRRDRRAGDDVLDLRKGRTDEGTVVETPSTAMSTAEAVSVAFAAGLDACYFGDGKMRGEHLAKQLVGTVLKDSVEDAKKVRQYFEVVVKNRAKRNEHWKSFYDGRGILGS